MPSTDITQAVKTALEANWTPPVPCQPTLRVDDDWRPGTDPPQLLVADDGGPAVFTGEWPWAKQLAGYAAPFRPRPTRRPLLRLTAFAQGRTVARQCVESAADHIVLHPPAEFRRIEDVPSPLITRDRDTGAFLASVLLPVVVRPVGE